MCRAVAEALATGPTSSSRPAPVRASRSAYLVPAALSGKKVVVATATKALQDQLAEKDLPLVEAGLGLPRPAGLRRAQGPQQLHLPPAGGRGGLGRDPARARRPGRGRARRRDAMVPPARRGARSRTTAAARGPGRRGAQPGRLVADVGHRRPGRPELRAVRPGLGHGERRPPGVPRRVQLPLGRALLRRGGPRPGGGGRRRRRQHPPLRRPPGQRRCRCCPSTTWSSSTRRTSSRRS